MSVAGLDRVKGQIAALIDRVASRMDFHALYPATVMAQNGQLLDVKPDSPRVPSLSGVPLRLGLPGAQVQVAAGARVLLGFEGGEPDRPVCTLWEHGSALTVTLEPFTELRLGTDGASEPVLLGNAFATLVRAAIKAAAVAAAGSAATAVGGAPSGTAAATAAAGTVETALVAAFDTPVVAAKSIRVKVS